MRSLLVLLALLVSSPAIAAEGEHWEMFKCRHGLGEILHRYEVEKGQIVEVRYSKDSNAYQTYGLLSGRAWDENGLYALGATNAGKVKVDGSPMTDEEAVSIRRQARAVINDSCAAALASQPK